MNFDEAINAMYSNTEPDKRVLLSERNKVMKVERDETKIKTYDSLTWILERELSQDKVLIIITGISGSGKSTLMEELQDRISNINSNFLSMDDFKIQEYQTYGFCNEMEKEILKDKAIDTFKMAVIMSAREGQNIIVEYPFAVKWQPFFDYIHTEYGYKRIIVNCNSRDFEEIWSNKVCRDLSPDRRHPALISNMFLDKNNYSINTEECSTDSKNKLYNLFISNYYNSIKGDVVYKESGWKEENIIL